MIKKEYKYSAITEKIIGCAMEVHRILGNGFPEKVYQRALAMELDLQGVIFSQEHNMPVYYKGIRLTTRRVDFLIENVISTELKAVVQLDDGHFNQAINYMEAYNLEIGLLINFGARSLQVKRLINNNH